MSDDINNQYGRRREGIGLDAMENLIESEEKAGNKHVFKMRLVKILQDVLIYYKSN